MGFLDSIGDAVEDLAGAVPWIAGAYAISQITKPEVVSGVTTLAGVGERTFGSVTGGISGILNAFGLLTKSLPTSGTVPTDKRTPLDLLKYTGVGAIFEEPLENMLFGGGGGSQGVGGTNLIKKIKSTKSYVPETRARTVGGVTIQQERKPGSSLWRNVTRTR